MSWDTRIQDRHDERHMYRQLNRQLDYLLGVTLLVFFLGILNYGEKFQFWKDALSFLGRLQTENGNPNLRAMMIFATGMLMCSFICLRIGNTLDGHLNHQLFWICGAGYIFMIMPCDLCNPVHSVGGALVFGTLWLFTLIRLVELNHLPGKFRIYLYHIVLHATVLPYAFLWVLNSPFQQTAQKFAFLGLILVLKLVNLENVRFAESHRS